MVEIRPFRGIRYNLDLAGSLADVIGPPEDIATIDEARAIVAGKPYNPVRLEVPHPGAPDDFRGAARCFHRWLHEGVLVRETRPSVYVHEHAFVHDGRRYRRRGFFAALRLPDAPNGQVLPHERIIPDTVAIRVAFRRCVRAELSAVYTLTDAGESLRLLLESVTRCEPVVAGADENGAHRLWLVDDVPTIAAFQAVVVDRSLVIADGHHRYAAALAYRDALRAVGRDPALADWVLTYIADVADPGVLVLPIHRLIRGIPSREASERLGRLASSFVVEEIALPEDGTAAVEQAAGELAALSGPPAFVVVGPGPRRLTRLRLRDWEPIRPLLPDEGASAVARLDATVLEAVLLRHALGLADADLVSAVDYAQDAAAAYKAVRTSDGTLAVLMRPVSLGDLLAVARAGERMPPKSTYFFPKIPVGLVLRDLREA